MNKYLIPAILIAILVVGWYSLSKGEPVGSVRSSDEYIATTTGDLPTVNGTPEVLSLRSGRGTLGSIVITGANTGEIFIYDATTTDNTLRASIATSSIFRGHIPISAVAGTYVFDIFVTTGLSVVIEGAAPTTTITYR